MASFFVKALLDSYSQTAQKTVADGSTVDAYLQSRFSRNPSGNAPAPGAPDSTGTTTGGLVTLALTLTSKYWIRCQLVTGEQRWFAYAGAGPGASSGDPMVLVMPTPPTPVQAAGSFFEADTPASLNLTAAAQTVNLTNVILDSASGWNSGTDIYTVPKTGTWRVTAAGAIVLNTSPTTAPDNPPDIATLLVKRNSSFPASLQAVSVIPPGATMTTGSHGDRFQLIPVTDAFLFNSGDTLSLQASGPTYMTLNKAFLGLEFLK